jgi:hypothetical protein
MSGWSPVQTLRTGHPAGALNEDGEFHLNGEE